MEPLKVTIGDHEYLLQSDGDEEELLRLAEYVNTKLREADGPQRGLTEKKTAILAALSIAGDYFQVLRERDGLRAKVRSQTEALIRHIESAMDESRAVVRAESSQNDPAMAGGSDPKWIVE
jgi:cell division protein ZapA (FtsZ GTPase activity inhibitor)